MSEIVQPLERRPEGRMRVMAIDPGQSAAGLVVMEFDPEIKGWEAIYAQAIRPPKDERKQDIRRSLRDAEGIAKIAREAAAALRDQRIRYVVAELPDAGAPRYSVCRAISLATGWLVGIIEALALAPEFYTPREVKLAGGGSATASKREIMAKMGTKYPLISRIRYAADREHIADAAAAFEAARNGPMIRMLEQGNG